LAGSGIARADASDDRLTAGGYFRLQAFTDFQGGNGQLGLSPLGCGVGGPCIYGRLMNEGPDLILEMRYLMIGSDKTSDTPWAALVLRAEGESFLGTDSGNGNLSNYAITRFAVDAGNLLLQNVTWRIGVLWYEPNNLGLYDMFLDDLFYGVMGASAFYKTPKLDLLVGIGDEGWQLLGSHYNTIYTGGGWVRWHQGPHFELGGGGQFGYEPAEQGNQNAPLQTPGVTYLEYYQQTAVSSFYQANPVPGTLFRSLGTGVRSLGSRARPLGSIRRAPSRSGRETASRTNPGSTGGRDPADGMSTTASGGRDTGMRATTASSGAHDAARWRTTPSKGAHDRAMCVAPRSSGAHDAGSRASTTARGGHGIASGTTTTSSGGHDTAKRTSSASSGGHDSATRASATAGGGQGSGTASAPLGGSGCARGSIAGDDGQDAPILASSPLSGTRRRGACEARAECQRGRRLPPAFEGT
jgi:hypothetical protein